MFEDTVVKTLELKLEAPKSTPIADHPDRRPGCINTNSISCV